jgi:hypothetical protein
MIYEQVAQPAHIGANEADAAYSTGGEIQPASPVGLYAGAIAVLVVALLAIAIACLILAVQMKHKVNDLEDDMEDTALLLASCACRCANITQAMVGPTGLILTVDGCYEITQDIVFDTFGLTAITLARGVVAEIRGLGHTVVLNSYISRAFYASNDAHLTLSNVHVSKTSVSQGTGIGIGPNATGVLTNIRCNGTGTCVRADARSSLILRNCITEIEFDSAEMADFWGFGMGYAGQGLTYVDDVNVDVDGLVVRCQDVRTVFNKAPNFGLDWFCRGLVGSLSSAPKINSSVHYNTTRSVLRNIVISGASSAFQVIQLDALHAENVVITCADGLGDGCVQIGSSRESGTATLRNFHVDARQTRPELYFIGDTDLYWLVPVQISGMSSLELDNVQIIGRGGQFNDTEGIFFGTPVVRRHPLLLLDSPTYCHPAVIDCVGSIMRNVVVRNSKFTATDDSTVPVMIGMGSGEGSTTSAHLENVDIIGGSIGLLIGPDSRTTRLTNVRIESPYYGVIVANDSAGLIADNLAVQRTCIPLWIQANAAFNLVKNSEFTLNGVGYINDNPTDNDVETTSDRYVQSDCGTAPELFEYPDFARYSDFVGGASTNATLNVVLPPRDGGLSFEELVALYASMATVATTNTTEVATSA